MNCAYVAMGSNKGRRQAALRRALERMAGLPGTRIVGVADFRETDPVAAPAGSPKFINGAVALETELGPRELLEALLRIESELGRDRSGEPKNGPRTIDLDLLLYGDLVVHEPGLELPHPRMQEREFVLGPLAQIAGEVRHPVLQATISELLGRLQVALRTGVA
ncbi:MAG TPA: 2-amino-4-hydroxy-6-hydroxymethyldihydropteridine diphosphokinase [Phycisphaerae bacterium]|nr:2-amino-4-hydroxy-6-hydroxymethyldihydropteridine diphosphokinase [Phycisphaerae bacterium]